MLELEQLRSTIKPDEKLIHLIARRIKMTKREGSFIAFQAEQKNGKLIDARFVQAINQKPTATCYVRVKIKDINIQTNCQYPKLWIKYIEDIYLDGDSETAVIDAPVGKVEEVF